MEKLEYLAPTGLTLQVQTFCYSLIDTKEKISQDYPNWNQIKDARVTMFSKCINTLNSVLLAVRHLQYDLMVQKKWQSICSNTIPVEDIQIMTDEFGMFVKIGFIQCVFSSIESSLRLFLKAVDPLACSNGTGEFKNVYSCLFKQLNLRKYETLLDLLRCVRNTIHNNGVYFHRRNNNETINYQGESYNFEIGKPINFVSWDFIFSLASDLEKMMNDVVRHNNISSFISIIDPFARV